MGFSDTFSKEKEQLLNYDDTAWLFFQCAVLQPNRALFSKSKWLVRARFRLDTRHCFKICLLHRPKSIRYPQIRKIDRAHNGFWKSFNQLWFLDISHPTTSQFLLFSGCLFYRKITSFLSLNLPILKLFSWYSDIENILCNIIANACQRFNLSFGKFTKFHRKRLPLFTDILCISWNLTG